MMTKAGEKYSFYEGDIYQEDFPGCCGVDVLTGFDVYPDTYGVELGPKLYNKIYKVMCAKREMRYVQVSLVSKYKTGKKEQIPGFIDWLIKEKKWVKNAKFINPNHGNEVTVLGKVFPRIKQKKTPANYLW